VLNLKYVPMKTLNKKSSQTMNKMVSMLEDGYIKIDNTGASFMPVSVEVIFENEKFKQISIAHYYEQNGDLMADPEMIIIYSKALDVFFASYFKQDNLGIEEDSIIMEQGEIKGYRAKMQADHAAFANLWLRNIKHQQNL
jgi:hypothetical protein